jgi:hypothetical protein
VNEEHIGARADATVGDLAGADIEKGMRRTTEEIGSFGRGEGRHRTSIGISLGVGVPEFVTPVVVSTSKLYSQ